MGLPDANLILYLGQVFGLMVAAVTLAAKFTRWVAKTGDRAWRRRMDVWVTSDHAEEFVWGKIEAYHRRRQNHSKEEER